MTPLMLATYSYVSAGRLETVEFLANAGANLNAQTKVGWLVATSLAMKY